ncbi:MAG: MBOAT family protein [Planctomycetes bacterium]|nr:MBOAT family protein [Planctomycetota bacterium]
MVWTFLSTWAMGLVIERVRRRGLALAVGVGLNLALLVFFKYTNFLVDNLNALLGMAGLPTLAVGRVHLPIGISFFVFQAVSYLVDVYRRDVAAGRSPIDYGCYKAFFPQLIAGPIVRYRDVAAQISGRVESAALFISGMRRFVKGLAKKVLIANTVAVAADAVFDLPPGDLSAAAAWFGLGCYAIQLYFDFSGYSDMAIGLGRMFGFTFQENFAHPYAATSLRELWNRWHISLSSWFRDYLFFPLLGRRPPAWRFHLSLAAVFVLCGLWHGAAWTFVLWGAWNGLFLVLERTPYGTLLERTPAPVRWGHTMLVWLLGLVLFRCSDLGHCWAFAAALAGFGGHLPAAEFADREILAFLAGGVLFSFPLSARLAGLLPDWSSRSWTWATAALLAAEAALLALVLLALTLTLQGQSSNPFIYFRF